LECQALSPPKSYTIFSLLVELHVPAAHGSLWIGGWVGSRTGLDHVERRQILPLSGLELRPLGRPARSQSLSDCAIPITHKHTQAHMYNFMTADCIVSIRINTILIPSNTWRLAPMRKEKAVMRKSSKFQIENKRQNLNRDSLSNRCKIFETLICLLLVYSIKW
jgi:hypothetical protein